MDRAFFKLLDISSQWEARKQACINHFLPEALKPKIMGTNKSKVMQIMQDASIQDPTSESYEHRIIRDNDFENIVDVIIRHLESAPLSDHGDVWTSRVDEILKFIDKKKNECMMDYVAAGGGNNADMYSNMNMAYGFVKSFIEKQSSPLKGAEDREVK